MRTQKAGTGFARVGSSSVGFGEPATTAEFSKAFVKSDGKIGNSRAINADTGKYEYNEVDGTIKGIDGAQQMVMLALKTVQGSSLINSLGNNLSSIKVINANIKAEVNNRVELALQSLIDRNIIILDKTDVQVDKVRNRTIIAVYWTDVSTQNAYQFQI